MIHVSQGASLVTQWLRITCSRRRHGLHPWLGRSHMPRNNKACAPQLLSLRSRACERQILSPCAAPAKPECRSLYAAIKKPARWCD